MGGWKHTYSNQRTGKKKDGKKEICHEFSEVDDN